MSLSAIAASSAVSSTSDSSAPSAEKVTLNKLLQQYSRDLQQGQTPAQLQSLARQIEAAAKTAGEHVRLPTVPASVPATPAAPANATSDTGTGVNTTA